MSRSLEPESCFKLQEYGSERCKGRTTDPYLVTQTPTHRLKPLKSTNTPQISLIFPFELSLKVWRLQLSLTKSTDIAPEGRGWLIPGLLDDTVWYHCYFFNYFSIHHLKMTAALYNMCTSHDV